MRNSKEKAEVADERGRCTDLLTHEILLESTDFVLDCIDIHDAPIPFNNLIPMVPLPRARKEAVITNKTRWYPAEDKPEPRQKSARQVAKPPRKSITPGTVLILLAGRFRGKRVVFLKQLESGLLLVTGPYRINGVPLRRVNQSYVIATSTKVDVSGVQIPDAVNDSYFAKEKSKKRGSAEAEFFEEGKPKTKEAHPEQKASTQKTLDQSVIAEVKKVEHLASYLKASWGLSKGQYPHKLKF